MDQRLKISKMKKTILILAGFILSWSAYAQTKTDTIYAKGNCGHCKERIEEAVHKIKGVSEATWDPTYARLICVYNTTETSNSAIQKVMAAIGHDTDLYRADDKVYKNLPACCKYERDPIQTTASKIQTYEFIIEGMTCAEGCAKGIELSVLKQKGIKSSKVDYDTKRAKVIFDNSKITKEQIIAIVEGFTPEGEAPHYKVVPLK